MRANVTWNPWQQLNRLHRELNQMFETATETAARAWNNEPAMKLWHSEDGLVVAMELPGWSVEDLDVTVQDQTLTIAGERTVAELPEGVQRLYQNRAANSFSRTVKLPCKVEPHSSQATYVKGVLYLELKRPENEKPAKIEVHVG